jgi:hypothetical protein
VPKDPKNQPIATKRTPAHRTKEGRPRKKGSRRIVNFCFDDGNAVPAKTKKNNASSREENQINHVITTLRDVFPRIPKLKHPFIPSFPN